MISSLRAMSPRGMLAALNLDRPAHYIHWHWFQISLPNLLVIVVMLVVFGLALLLPFPRGRRS